MPSMQGMPKFLGVSSEDTSSIRNSGRLMRLATSRNSATAPGSDAQGSKRSGPLEALRGEVEAALGAACRRPMYHARRFNLIGDFEGIRSPWRRHAVPLSFTPDLDAALAGIAWAAFEAGLPRSSHLVELSAAVTLPGASAQNVHSDISPAIANIPPSGGGGGGAACSGLPPLVTAWLAVQPVLDASMGPTTVFPGTHRRLVERAVRIEEERVQDSVLLAGLCDPTDPEHVSVEATLFKATRAKEKRKALEADVERELRDFGPASAACDLLLGCGDVALMDCRLIHFGSAYPGSRSSRLPFAFLRCAADEVPRILINATFASEGVGSDEIRGFTYHRTAKFDLTLGDLLDKDASRPLSAWPPPWRSAELANGLPSTSSSGGLS
mmetsp:Transcript_172881/g.554300  ORF Transcript_172881/g.554300 Transcript_172881/m.554300 type:complete len:383 (-) Transcript_172881:61-1209(-)